MNQTMDHPTLQEVLELWLENNRIRLRDQTVAKYRGLIDRHILPVAGRLPAEQIDMLWLNRFLREKSGGGRVDGAGGLSPSYIRALAFIIKSALSFAARNRLCPPLVGELMLPPVPKNALEVLSRSEQHVLEQQMPPDPCRHGLGVLLSLYMGLRVGEVCGLRWGDIDFQNAVLHVRHTVERISNLDPAAGGSKTRLVMGTVKTVASDRVIPLPSRLFGLLRHCRGPEDAFVLPGRTYPYTDPRALQYYFRRYLARCGLRPLNFHTLRHTFATRCMESGMDTKSLSELLGHSSVNITLSIYVHSSIEHKRAQLETMAAFCGPARECS